ncbi:MAG: hypothetical protein CMH31_01480 [Micavibrio sp.]|nr:hypothetical protein [Micavibrio sp.]|tara:strand:- start:2347 stop:2688 length:342 start_codon:yes stop_codon:yes gene_type:complete
MTDNITLLTPDILTKNLEIFEVKQLADKEAVYKALCNAAIKRYKNWKKTQIDQTDLIELLYGGMEGKMHRQMAIESIRLYWSIRKHFRISFAHYLEKTGCYPSTVTSRQKLRA